MLQHGGIDGEDRVRVAFRLEQPGADVELVRTQVEDGIVQLASHLQWPPSCALCLNSADVLRLRRHRRLHRQACGALGTADFYIDKFIAVRGVVNAAMQRGQSHALAVRWPIAG